MNHPAAAVSHNYVAVRGGQISVWYRVSKAKNGKPVWRWHAK